MPGPGGGGQQINSLMDLVGTSFGGNTFPMNPASYSLGPSLNTLVPINYNPSGTYTGTPTQFPSGVEYGAGTPYGPWTVGTQSGRGGGGSGENSPGGFDLYRDWRKYASNDLSTGGGFFSIKDLFDRQAQSRQQQQQQPMPPAGGASAGGTGLAQNAPWGSRGPGEATPQAFQFMQDQPSTNNWRLMPPQFRQPGYIMRNGIPINTLGSDYAPGLGFTSSGGTDAPPTRILLRPGEGFPALVWPGTGFWPGQVINPWRYGVHPS